MITDKDIDKLKQVFPTKEDLRGFATKDDLLDFKLEILNEIRVLRDEVTIVVGYRDDIEDHEKRITKLENVKSP